MSLDRRGLLVAGTGITATLVATGTAIAQGGQASQAYQAYGAAAITDAQTGKLPNVETKLGIITRRHLETEAQKVMAPFGFAYVAGGAGDESAMRENQAPFGRWVIAPDHLSGHKTVDTTTRTLGSALSYPVITAPMGNQGSVQAPQEEPIVKGTALCRPVLYGSALGGSLGVQGVHEHQKGELVMVTQLAGTPTIKSITRGHTVRAELDA